MDKPADKRAQDIIALRNKERGAQSQFRSLWQETADFVFPREDQINTQSVPGTDKMRNLYDTTAILDSQDMASGLSGALIPTGQKFFGLRVSDRDVADIDAVARYLSLATEVTHEQLFESNFMLQLNETLRSLVVFGTGNLYSEWNPKTLGLNFKDFDIGLYQIREDSMGRVDTVILTYTLTARQAVQEFGVGNVGDDIQKLADTTDKAETAFEFIQIVRPRSDRNPNLSDNLNMPFECLFVDVKGQLIVKESGFEEMPFAVARWMKSSNEKYGRGQGTEVLADVKMMQQMKKDFIDCGNRWNNPPLEVLESFEGRVNITPGALNFVRERKTIAGIEQQVLGNFPVTREMLEFQQEVIHKAFFRDIFVQLSGLTGDRRTTVEIIERIREGLRRLALPVSRVQSELFNPVIMRSVLLLVRNGRIPYPPPELQGRQFGIEYQGELALALRNQQAKGFQQWAEFVAAMEQVFPGVSDNVEADRAVRRMAESFGVNVGDLATDEEVQAKREARRQTAAANQAAALAGAAAEGYGKTNKAPEPGSPAEALMGAMK